MDVKNLKAGTKNGDNGEPVVNLKEYLKNFGYLAQHAMKDNFAMVKDIKLPISDDEVFDDATETALKNFQRYYHLKQTGTLTEETIHLIGSPRCGNPDKPKLVDPQTGMVANFVAQGNKWGKTNVTYSFQNFTGDLSSADIIVTIRSAFESWSNVCFITFTETTGNADIIIRFATRDHGDGHPFDGPGNVLAHGFYPPPNGGDLAGDLHFDDDETWSLTVPTPASRFDLWSVALHEIGHTLGLDHSNVAASVMYAYYSGIRRALHQDDINGIASIYGPRSPKTTLTDTAIGQPSFTSQNGTGFIAWTGTDPNHHLNVMQTRNTRVWTDKCILGETSLSGPSITTHNGRLYLVWRGVGNNQVNVISSADGRTWTNKVTLGETTFNSPSICSVNGRLILAWTGTDNQRRLNILQSNDGISWTGKVTLGETSIDGPSVCNLGNRLLLSWTGTDSAHRLNVISFDGTNWFNKVTLGETSFRTPNLNNVNGTIILSWAGTDPNNRLNTLRSSNGVNFVSKATYNDTSNFAPNIGSLNNQALIVWTGKDNAQSLNVMNI